jgi:hypothetical protein
MFDPLEFFAVSVAGIPLIFVVMGLVTLWGELGLKGRAQLVSSFITGLLIGGLYQLAELGVPVDFAGWFALAIFGLGLGVVTSGLYETAGKLVRKAIAQPVKDEPDLIIDDTPDRWKR